MSCQYRPPKPRGYTTPHDPFLFLVSPTLKTNLSTWREVPPNSTAEILVQACTVCHGRDDQSPGKNAKCWPRPFSQFQQLLGLLWVLRLKDHWVPASHVIGGREDITGTGSAITSTSLPFHIQSAIKKDIGLFTVPMSLTAWGHQLTPPPDLIGLTMGD